MQQIPVHGSSILEPLCTGDADSFLDHATLWSWHHLLDYATLVPYIRNTREMVSSSRMGPGFLLLPSGTEVPLSAQLLWVHQVSAP